MTSETTVRFRAGEIELDGRMLLPPNATRACVVCHPHPLYGGDMNSSVVVAIAQALAAAGVAALRFDFRGVGRSGGTHGGGVAEIDDARAAVDCLAEASGVAGVTIAGYSFGSLVALRLAESIDGADGTAVGAVAAIAPPLAMFDASFLASLRMPLLVLAGDRDAYCPRDAFETLGGTLSARATTSLLRAADHFFAGRESEVAETVAGWVGGLPE